MQTSTLFVLAAIAALPLIGLFGRSDRTDSMATELAPTSHTPRGDTVEIATFAAG